MLLLRQEAALVIPIEEISHRSASILFFTAVILKQPVINAIGFHTPIIFL
jgi:hypothetical protein